MKFNKGKHSGKTSLSDRKKRKLSSNKWLTRHINDPFVQKAKEQKLRSRSAFKLIEIERKFKIFRHNDIVIDIGAAPGGWSLVAAKKINHKEQKAKIIAIDLLDFPDIDNTIKIIADFTKTETQDKIIELLNGKKPNVIMSDIAANNTGIKRVDRWKNHEIALNVLEFIRKTLVKDGTIILKLFQGGFDEDFLKTISKLFAVVHKIKPMASRKTSPEIYLVAKNFCNHS